MNALATLAPTALADFSGPQLTLIKNTVARDTNSLEFDHFMTVARMAGLNPFTKQIYAVVYHKDDSKKRKMEIITGINGLRAIAARSRRYRPADKPTAFDMDETLRGPLNPLGLVTAFVTIYMKDADNSDWFPVSGEAEWLEYAPIKDEWAWSDEQRKKMPTGRLTLDASGKWAQMPKNMLAKCAEAQALRRAFPEDLSGIYAFEEMDQASRNVVELLPSEVIVKSAEDDRLAMVGAKGAIMFQITPASSIEPIPFGQVFDTVAAAVREFETVSAIRWFAGINKAPLQEFWGKDKGAAHELKKLIEDRTAELMAAEEKLVAK
jgi:phage recombination protein Bet